MIISRMIRFILDNQILIGILIFLTTLLGTLNIDPSMSAAVMLYQLISSLESVLINLLFFAFLALVCRILIASNEEIISGGFTHDSINKYDAKKFLHLVKKDNHKIDG